MDTVKYICPNSVSDETDGLGNWLSDFSYNKKQQN